MCDDGLKANIIDLLKYSFYLVLAAIPSFIILGWVVYCFFPDNFNDEAFDDYADITINNNNILNPLLYEVSYENDTVRISTIHFHSKEPYIPGITEVWRVNKLSGDSILCAKSNPRYFGKGSDSIDSIPSILEVIYRPDKEKLIVEGPTCHAGTMATYIVDAKTGEYLCLPTNNGFIGYTNWDGYLIASSKFNDIDNDLLLFYENIYIMDWDGKIISTSSTKDRIIEDALPEIHHEAGWDIVGIKLNKHIRLKPQYPDSLYYGNEFHVKYPELAMKEISNFGSYDPLPKGWSKHGKKYYYYSDDPEYGLFLTILVDSRNNIGIIRRGVYSNTQNKPQRLYE